MRKLVILALSLSLSSCLLFDPDARVPAFCQLLADECDQDEEDIEDCIEDGRADRQFMREQGEDCVEVLIAQNDFHACVLAENDIDCAFFPVFDGCEDEFEELINETIEAGNDCAR
jgi:hypothetical protein